MYQVLGAIGSRTGTVLLHGCVRTVVLVAARVATSVSLYTFGKSVYFIAHKQTPTRTAQLTCQLVDGSCVSRTCSICFVLVVIVGLLNCAGLPETNGDNDNNSDDENERP
jgi:L-asparagine transporter-like permease